MNAAEAQLMLSRSEIRAETRFSTCPGGGEGGSVQKRSVFAIEIRQSITRFPGALGHFC
jgi:hypothetical protein